jgi:MtN3 and saliva related transmembrane protein
MTLLGSFAGTLTTLAFLPQVVRSYRLRSAAELSWWWLLVFATGVAAWACYGVVRSDPAIIWTNSLTLVLVMSLIVLRARGTR